MNSLLHLVRLGKRFGCFDIFFDVFLEVVEGLLDQDLVIGVEYDVNGLTRISGKSTPTLPADRVQSFVFTVFLGESM